jgi:hypothetical protein
MDPLLAGGFVTMVVGSMPVVGGSDEGAVVRGG